MKHVFLSPDEVCKRWRNSLSIGTLRNWRSAGKGPPFVKNSNKVLYRLDELEQWERENLRASWTK